MCHVYVRSTNLLNMFNHLRYNEEKKYSSFPKAVRWRHEQTIILICVNQIQKRPQQGQCCIWHHCLIILNQAMQEQGAFHMNAQASDLISLAMQWTEKMRKALGGWRKSKKGGTGALQLIIKHMPNWKLKYLFHIIILAKALPFFICPIYGFFFAKCEFVNTNPEL